MECSKLQGLDFYEAIHHFFYEYITVHFSEFFIRVHEGNYSGQANTSIINVGSYLFSAF